LDVRSELRFIGVQPEEESLMKFVARVAFLLAFAAVGTFVLAGTAGAAQPSDHGAAPVFVQTDNPAGNQIVAYDRASDGSLTQAGVYDTGGLGGVLSGSVVDHTASQGALAYDAANGLLLAVNAGSDSVSVFKVIGDRLVRVQVVSSGGSFPVSVAVSHGVVYVLNARNGGSIQGFLALGAHLLPLPGSARPLGLDPTAQPEFTNTPGQVAFTPDGRDLIVTTKANGNAIDVFGVGGLGYLTATPVSTVVPGGVPFAVAFDRSGDLVASEAGPNALQTFRLNADRSLTSLQTIATGQAATCWIVGTGSFFYASNAGSGTVSRFASAADGTLTLLGATGTDAGTVDGAATPDGSFLYVQTGAAGKVDAFQVGADGSLTAIGSVTVPGAVGGEGIVAL
jgi:6-phosphogluconolactonase (cycloisomerase 2 family)